MFKKTKGEFPGVLSFFQGDFWIPDNIGTLQLSVPESG